MSRRTLGILALIVSTVMWLAVFAVPLTPLGTAQKVSAAAVLYGGSWVFFALAIAAMGKEGYEALKKQVSDRFRGCRDED